jgi:hypothetical protein
MFARLIELAGLWFLAAAALEFVAVFVEQAGAARSPEEDASRGKLANAALMLAALATPGLLLAHAFLVTHEADIIVRVWAMGAPIAAMLGGSILGGVFGALARGAAPSMRKVAPVLSLAALAATIVAAWPSILVLIAAARNGGVIYITP